MIQEQFGFDIPVFIILQDEIRNILDNAPNWWGLNTKEIYDNLIFVFPPIQTMDIAKKIGEPTGGLEQIQIFNNVIYWSFDRKKYSKSNWWKSTGSKGIGEYLTIRTFNTIKKISSM